MTIMPIVQDPDPKLREISVRIDAMTPALRKLAGDMLDTMRFHHAWGLSAIQVGVAVRMITLNPQTGIPFQVIINPTILSVSQALQRSTEGCLSIGRGQAPKVALMRPAMMRVTFFDRAEQAHGLDLRGLSAVVMQHEVDHLDGRLITDYATMSAEQRAS